MTSDTVVAYLGLLATYRRCSKCRTKKPPYEFYFEAARRHGKGGYRPDCRACCSALRVAGRHSRTVAL